MHILLLAAIILLGAWVGLRLKLPAGAMIGAMVAVAAYNIAFGGVHFPAQSKILVQAMAGGFIGQGITRDTVRHMRELVAPTAFVVVLMILEGVALGYLLHLGLGMELDTALLSSAPGGIVDITLISMDMGADSATVVVMHTVRLCSIILLCPPMIKWMSARFDPAKPDAGEEPEPRADGNPGGWQRTMVTLAVALAGGIIGYRLGIPAGILFCSMMAVAVLALTWGKAYMPSKLRRAAQVLAGAVIGQGIGMDQVVQMKGLVLPVIVMVSFLLACNAASGLIMMRLFHVRLANAMFSTSPAGASDMVLIAGDMGVSDVGIAVMHIARLVSVIAVFPMLVTVLAR